MRERVGENDGIWFRSSSSLLGQSPLELLTLKVEGHSICQSHRRRAGREEGEEEEVKEEVLVEGEEKEREEQEQEATFSDLLQKT